MELEMNGRRPAIDRDIPGCNIERENPYNFDLGTRCTKPGGSKASPNKEDKEQGTTPSFWDCTANLLDIPAKSK